MIRIISGLLKGKNLKLPKGADIRPTSDKVRGAIFNILGTTIIDANVLDLFSGTGALGIEALSRGAGSVVFVDTDLRCLTVIKDNLQSCGRNAEIVRGDVYRILDKFHGEKFDIIFADPPYDKNLAKNLLLQLDKYNIIANSSFVVIEHSKRETIEAAPSWQKLRENKYGDTVVSVYKKINATGRASPHRWTRMAFYEKHYCNLSRDV